jgi:predicted ArsR family transcriptional regulator
MNNKIKIKEKLLNELSHTPMNRQQMADYLNVTVIFIARYITELRASKQIYIHHYERTNNGKPKSFYATGNKPDAEELPPIPQRILQQKYREQNQKELKPKKFVPRMDEAASWMFNPC